jgi:hypothetical protein
MNTLESTTLAYDANSFQEHHELELMNHELELMNRTRSVRMILPIMLRLSRCVIILRNDHNHR